MRSVLKAVGALFLVFCAVVSAQGSDFQLEKLGRLPVVIVRNPGDKDLLRQQVQMLGECGYSQDINSCLISSGNRHVAAVTMNSDGKYCAWLDGKKGPAYDDIRSIVKNSYENREFWFSLDGRRLAYTALKGNNRVMVIDGKESAEYDGLKAAYFSADSKHVSYMVRKNDKFSVVIDGKESAKYSGIRCSLPYIQFYRPVLMIRDPYNPVAFSSNGRSAFIAIKGSNRELVVVDGKEGPVYDQIRSVDFSPDGNRVAYVAIRKDKQFMVVDGKEGPKYTDVDAGFSFSPNGKRLAYVASTEAGNSNRNTFVVVDGKPGPKYEQIDSPSLMFSPDGKHFTYTVVEDSGAFTVLDGKPGPKYDEIGGPCGGMAAAYAVFSPKNQFIYKAKKGEKCYMVIDGNKSPAYDDIDNYCPVFNADGSHMAYAVMKDEKWMVVLDGVPGPAYDMIYGDSINFTPGGHFIYTARTTNGDLVAVVDGKELPKSVSNPVFSPDGKHMAYCAWKDKQGVVAVDDKVSPEFESILPPFFNDNGELECLALRNDGKEGEIDMQLYRVKLKL